MGWWFVISAVGLIAVGGLATAIASSLEALSRNDLVEEAERTRTPQTLQRIAADLPTHILSLIHI